MENINKVNAKKILACYHKSTPITEKAKEILKSENKHDFSEEERTHLAKKGEAMENGSFPIRNEQDLKDAIKSYGLARNKKKAKEWIIKRAKDLNQEKSIPKEWVEKSMDTTNTPSKPTHHTTKELLQKSDIDLQELKNEYNDWVEGTEYYGKRENVKEFLENNHEDNLDQLDSLCQELQKADPHENEDPKDMVKVEEKTSEELESIIDHSDNKELVDAALSELLERKKLEGEAKEESK